MERGEPVKRMAMWCVLALAGWLVALAGCATLPQQVERTPSQALTDTAQTRPGGRTSTSPQRLTSRP